MLINPVANPWCRPVASAASLSIAIAGAKQTPAPRETAIRTARITPSAPAAGTSAIAAAEMSIPAA